MAPNEQEQFRSLAQLAAQRESDLRQEVANPWVIKHLWRSDPERLKVLALIAAELGDVQRFAAHWLEERSLTNPNPARLMRLNSLVADISPTDRDSAWEFVDALRSEKLWIAPNSFIQARLETEAAPRRRSVRWEEFFDKADLARLREHHTSRGAPVLESTKGDEPRHVDHRVELAEDEWRQESIERLAELQWQRAELGRHTRVRTALRGVLLLLLVPVFVVLLITTSFALRSEWALLGAVFAGALGSATSGAFTLRDEIQRVREMRSFLPLIGLQPILGAVMGLVTFLALDSGIIRIADISPDYRHYAAFAFGAGLSEPVFFGIAGRLAVAGNSEQVSSNSTKSEDDEADASEAE